MAVSDVRRCAYGFRRYQPAAHGQRTRSTASTIGSISRTKIRRRAVIFKQQFGDRGSAMRLPILRCARPSRTARRSIRFRPDTGGSNTCRGRTIRQHLRRLGTPLHASTTRSCAQGSGRRALPQAQSRPAPSRRWRKISGSRRHGEGLPHHARRPRFELLTGVGEFTSACGITFYLGGAFPVASSGVLARRRARAQPRAPRRLTPSAPTSRAAREGRSFSRRPTPGSVR